MDLSNIFSSLKRQFAAINQPNVAGSQENVIPLGSADDSSNVNTPCGMDENESYLVVNANLDVEEMDQNEPAFLPNDEQSSASHSLQDNSASLHHKNAISDVPFQLHDSLVTQQQVNSMFTDALFTHHIFDWGKYYVDFSCEQAVLSGYSVKKD